MSLHSFYRKNISMVWNLEAFLPVLTEKEISL